jgi:hypothetical protein
MCAGGMFADWPYGYNLFKYDLKLSKSFCTQVYQQFDAVRSNDNHVTVNFCSPQDLCMVSEVMKERKYSNVENLYWFKPGQTMTGTPKSYTPAVETGLIGFYPSSDDIPWYTSADPVKRHNVLHHPSVKTLAKNAVGGAINVTEKPPALAKWILGNHCEPGSTVLIVGAGAGGDIVGAVQANLNVVAVEVDRMQFEALRAHLEFLVSTKKNEILIKEVAKRKQDDSDDEDEHVEIGFAPTMSPQKSKVAVAEVVCYNCEKELSPTIGNAPVKVCAVCKKRMCDTCGNEKENDGKSFIVCDPCNGRSVQVAYASSEEDSD